MKFIASLTAITLLASSGAALAQKPADPGGFGQDRRDYIQSHMGVGGPGASGTAQIISDRGGDNGSINNQYKVDHGQVPAGVTPGDSTAP